MKTVDKVKKTLRKYSMILQNDHVLVGLSGGPDSVCLLTILNRLKPELNIRLSAAYINHALRPDETPYEIDFCKELCGSLGIPFFTSVINVNSYARKKRLNKQEAARELRYNALEEIALQKAASKIAVGHNANDQAETVLMRLFRGAGPLGLSGIPPVRKHIIRPLIEIERKEIEQFLKDEGIGFIVDSSNLKNTYLRNRIRHFMIPAIQTFNNDIIKTLSRTADIFRDEERHFEILVTKTLMKLITRKTDKAIELFLIPLKGMDTVMLRRVLRRAVDETKGLGGINFIHIEEMIDIIKSGKSGDRIYLPNGMRAINGYSTFTITSEQPIRLSTYIIDSPGELVLKESSMVIKSSIFDISEFHTLNSEFFYGNGKTTVVIDADKAHFPLTIRGRLQGDYFYPLGFGKKKKIQDYFVDEKIHRDERDAIPILTSGNSIVWIVGYRMDERYKVDKDTKRVLKLDIKPLKT
jgi:tRNA(Ile)-lysidine synthase